MQTTNVPNPSAADGKPVYLLAVPVVGSPQGVLSAFPGTIAVDTTTGNIWAKQSGTGNTGWVMSSGGGGGGGTVTSVAFAGDGTIFSSTAGTPVTTSGNLTPTLKTQNANVLLAGPSTGSASNPTWRQLVNADFPGTLAPTISGANISNLNASHITGTLPSTVFPSPMPFLNGPVSVYGGDANITEGTSICTSSNEVVQFTLPQVSGVGALENGAIFIVKVTGSVLATVINVNPNDPTPATIDGGSQYVLSSGQYEAVMLVYGNGIFNVLAHYLPGS